MKPPAEAQLGNKLWLLKKGVYGLADASRLCFLKFRNFLIDLGFTQFGDSDSVYMLKQLGKLIGLVATHVEDILYSGTEEFLTWFNSKVKQSFTVSKFESGNFKYTGVNITSDESQIILDQNDTAMQLNFLNLSDFQEGEEAGKRGEHLTRQTVGQAGWLVYQTRPDLAFRTLALTSVQQ